MKAAERREKREMYCGEKCSEDNDVGACGSIKKHRGEDKREGCEEGGSSLCVTFSSLCRDLKICIQAAWKEES